MLSSVFNESAFLSSDKFSDGICMTHVDDIPILMSSGFGGGKMVLSWMDIITTQSKLQANGSNPIEMHNLALLLKTVMQNLGLQVSCRNQTSERTSKVGYMMGDPKVSGTLFDEKIFVGMHFDGIFYFYFHGCSFIYLFLFIWSKRTHF